MCVCVCRQKNRYGRLAMDDFVSIERRWASFYSWCRESTFNWSTKYRRCHLEYFLLISIVQVRTWRKVKAYANCFCAFLRFTLTRFSQLDRDAKKKNASTKKTHRGPEGVTVHTHMYKREREREKSMRAKSFIAVSTLLIYLFLFKEKKKKKEKKGWTRREWPTNNKGLLLL